MSSNDYRLAAEQVRVWERTDHQIEFEADKTRKAIAGLESNIENLEEAIQKMNGDLKAMRPNTDSGLENKVAMKERQVSFFSKGLHKFFLLQACPSPPTLYLETTSKISYSTTEPCEFVNWAVDKSSPPTSLMQLSHPRH